jgi:quercetin dioxygenase-like cupin family protein
MKAMSNGLASRRRPAAAAGDDLLADEYALGLIEGRRLARAEGLLRSDAAFREQVEAARHRLAALDEAGPVVVPPARLFGAIRARLADAPKPVTVTAAQGDWRPLSPGIAIKVLHEDGAGRLRSLLMRMEAGAVLTAHPHPHAEECVVLEGSLESEGAVLRPGDYQRAAPGRPHGTVRSTSGALLFIRLD